MPTADPQAPATKEDIGYLMGMIGDMAMDIRKLHVHFDFSVEQLRKDYLDANREEIIMLKDDMAKVKQKVGIR